MKAPILETERLILKPLSTIHITPIYVSWLNDEEVYRYLETRGNYTMELLTDYVENVIEKDIYFWGIHTKYEHRHIGNIKIDPIDVINGFGEYGILIGDRDSAGLGYALEASKCVISYCFDDLSLNKINLGVVFDNKQAIRLYEKLGFLTESRLKDYVNYNGISYDVLRMSVIKSKLVCV
jgi:[ribosomal protein S5]-alanine N-acetyltransferase